MKKTVRSPGSATVINAIATGRGSAFGIGLRVEAEAELIDSGVECISREGADTSLMELCTRMVIEHYGVDAGVRVVTSSDLPVASGLSSSSAASNATVMAVSSLLSDEFGLQPMEDFEMLNMAVDASLQAGVSVTGAYDDASASFYGGLTVTDNMERRIILREPMENQKVLIYMPDRKSLTAQSDVPRMKLLAPWVDMAFREVLDGRVHSALTLNGILYCASLGFDPGIALDALEAGALAAGLSGTGPSFVALTHEDSEADIIDAWENLEGDVLVTSVDNEGTRVLE
ncbi:MULTISPECIES: shikimate kinase [Methanothermobacter]|uniref:Shikimate kinase n=1 Tax=Methanothermobacter thermautotrophicus TaxID=145262 RepID=A0A7J4MWE7_METTF|nr:MULTISPECIES: shikimate kinase [Methanothermobacter]WBF07026.1 shikimate kinase [Methanothermobacter thermautotrophicus]BAM69970.1 putative shikimate kinase [Methanothermobacter sp. CaT2]HIH64933.1 shikimate kinase [Methanothermobacter thermautotrophicus]HIH70681.1 shikimate kinase [Methanothermobacter thermautotrophicus]